MPYKPNEREYRNFTQFNTPDGEGDNLILRGSPVLFNRETVICVIDGVEYKEVIATGALDGCDMRDFIFNRNHGQNDSTVFCRTKNGSLKYQITAASLDCDFYLDSEDERHRNLYRDIQKKRIDKMSFSFIVAEYSYNKDTHTRTILKIKKLFDVSAVDFAAYDETSITTARDFFSAENEKEFKELEERRRRQILIARTLL